MLERQSMLFDPSNPIWKKCDQRLVMFNTAMVSQVAVAAGVTQLQANSVVLHWLKVSTPHRSHARHGLQVQK